MAAERSLEVCGLNIEAHPHPEGIYVTLLRLASKGLVQARGSDYAKITTPHKHPRFDNTYTGRVLMWTDIDLRGRWLDLSNEEDLPHELKRSINIPDNAKPNFRVFHYVLDARKHHIWFESRNEENERMGPTTALRIFDTLLQEATFRNKIADVTVTIIPQENAVKTILATPNLRTLTIRVTRPNPDASSPEARKRVFDRLDASHASQLELRLTKSSNASRLTPTDADQELAEVGADSGFVRAEGRDANGTKIERSSDKMPKILRIGLGEGNNFLARLLSAIQIL